MKDNEKLKILNTTLKNTNISPNISDLKNVKLCFNDWICLYNMNYNLLKQKTKSIFKQRNCSVFSQCNNDYYMMLNYDLF